MDYTSLIAIVLGSLVSGLSALAGVWLQSFLSRHQTKTQFLMETRRSVYSQLLSAVVTERRYPEDRNVQGEASIKNYNEQLSEWRQHRKEIKRLAAEALLLTENDLL